MNINRVNFCSDDQVREVTVISAGSYTKEKTIPIIIVQFKEEESLKKVIHDVTRDQLSKVAKEITEWLSFVDVDPTKILPTLYMVMRYSEIVACS